MICKIIIIKITINKQLIFLVLLSVSIQAVPIGCRPILFIRSALHPATSVCAAAGAGIRRGAVSSPQSVTADAMPAFPAQRGWHMPVFVALSLLLHLTLVAGFLRDDPEPALLMAGAEGGVMAITMVHVASQPRPVASPVPEPVRPEATRPQTRPQAMEAPAPPRPDALITLPAAREKIQQTAARKEEKPQKKPVREAQPKRTPAPAASQPARAEPATAAAVARQPGQQAVQTDAATGSTRSVSAARTGNSDSGRAQQGAGNRASQNLKALHRRVNYPQRAKAMGVEGQVRIQFDITASGTITNVRILSEKPAGMFAAAIKKDISRWRYQTQGAVNDQTVAILFKLNGQIELGN